MLSRQKSQRTMSSELYGCIFFNCPKCTFYFSGSYSLHSMDANGHVVYKHETNLVSFYLHYTVDSEYNWSGWQFTRDIHDIFGFISNDNDDTCPHGAKKSPWRCFMKKTTFLRNFSYLFSFFRYHLNGAWFNDDSVVISCEGDGPTTPASTTSRPDTTTSQNNGPTTTASPKGTEYLNFPIHS